MTWRYAIDHKAETREVKAALVRAGLPILSVRHGRGTAWAWLEINLGPNPGGLAHIKGDPAWLCAGNCLACEANRRLENLARHIAQEFTGRRGDHNGDILILTQKP